MSALLKGLKLSRCGKKKDLRQACLEKYGEEFIRLYDSLAAGKAIGDLYLTISVVDAIEVVRKEVNHGTA